MLELHHDLEALIEEEADAEKRAKRRSRPASSDTPSYQDDKK